MATPLEITNTLLDKLLSRVDSLDGSNSEDYTIALNQYLSLVSSIRSGYQFSSSDLLSLPDTIRNEVDEKVDLDLSNLHSDYLSLLSGAPTDIGNGEFSYPNGDIKGSNGNGDYIKFANGSLICFYTYSSSLHPHIRNFGCYFIDFDFIFPLSFLHTPNISLGCIVNNGIGFGCINDFPNVGGFNYRLASISDDCYAIPSYIAIGKWK